MYNNIDNLKEDLKELCLEYVNILENLKEDGIISQDAYEKCVSEKISFLEG